MVQTPSVSEDEDYRTPHRGSREEAGTLRLPSVSIQIHESDPTVSFTMRSHTNRASWRWRLQLMGGGLAVLWDVPRGLPNASVCAVFCRVAGVTHSLPGYWAHERNWRSSTGSAGSSTGVRRRRRVCPVQTRVGQAAGAAGCLRVGAPTPADGSSLRTSAYP